MQQDDDIQVTSLSATSPSSVPSETSGIPIAPQQQQQYLSAAFKASKSRTHLSLQSKPEAAAAAGGNNGRQRSTSLMAPNEMPRRMTKNYKDLARDFRMLKPFTRLPDSTYPPDTQCVFCEIGSPMTVFFPCQHKCVCDVCIKLHDITSDRSKATSWR